MTLDISKIKLPPWRADRPAYWFKLADAKFALWTDPAPTEAQKLALAQEVIPGDLVEKHESVWDITGVDAKPYTKLKEAIAGASQKSPTQLFNELMNLKLTSKPSDFFRDGQVILKQVTAQGKAMTVSQRDGWLLKQLLERQLPETVANALVRDTVDSSSPQGYLDKADELFNSATARASAGNTATVAEETVSAVTAKSGNRFNKPTKKTGGGKVGGKDGKYYFHTRFGDKARSCEGECTEKGKPLAKKSD